MNIQKKESVPQGLTIDQLVSGCTYVTDRGDMYLVDNHDQLINLASGTRVLAVGGKLVFYRVLATVTWEYAK